MAEHICMWVGLNYFLKLFFVNFCLLFLKTSKPIFKFEDAHLSNESKAWLLPCPLYQYVCNIFLLLVFCFVMCFSVFFCLLCYILALLVFPFVLFCYFCYIFFILLFLICVLYGCQVVFSLQEKLPHAKSLVK